MTPGRYVCGESVLRLPNGHVVQPGETFEHWFTPSEELTLEQSSAVKVLARSSAPEEPPAPPVPPTPTPLAPGDREPGGPLPTIPLTPPPFAPGDSDPGGAPPQAIPLTPPPLAPGDTDPGVTPPSPPPTPGPLAPGALEPGVVPVSLPPPRGPLAPGADGDRLLAPVPVVSVVGTIVPTDETTSPAESDHAASAIELPPRRRIRKPVVEE